MFEGSAPPRSLRELFGTTTLVVGGIFGVAWIAVFTHALLLFVPQVSAGRDVEPASAVLAAIAPLLLIALFGTMVTFGLYCARRNQQVIVREGAH